MVDTAEPIEIINQSGYHLINGIPIFNRGGVFNLFLLTNRGYD
jgi:hypothetical protein